MTLPYDIARCQGKSIDGQWREGCEDCQRRTSPGNPYRQIHMTPPAIVVFECARRIPPRPQQKGKTMSGQPEALRLAQALEYCDASVARQAINELRRLHAENASLTTGYDAARHEIDDLRARVQELGQIARDCNSRRVVELQAKVQELEDMLAAVGAGGVEPLRKADHLRGATKMVHDQFRDGTKMMTQEPEGK